MNATAKNKLNPAHETIAQRAYELWEQDGRQTGQDAKYWLQAENELRHTSEPTIPSAPRSRANSTSILGVSRPSRKSRASVGR